MAKQPIYNNADDDGAPPPPPWGTFGYVPAAPATTITVPGTVVRNAVFKNCTLTGGMIRPAFHKHPTLGFCFDDFFEVKVRHNPPSSPVSMAIDVDIRPGMLAESAVVRFLRDIGNELQLCGKLRGYIIYSDEAIADVLANSMWTAWAQTMISYDSAFNSLKWEHLSTSSIGYAVMRISKLQRAADAGPVQLTYDAPGAPNSGTWTAPTNGVVTNGTFLPPNMPNPAWAGQPLKPAAAAIHQSIQSTLHQAIADMEDEATVKMVLSAAEIAEALSTSDTPSRMLPDLPMKFPTLQFSTPKPDAFDAPVRCYLCSTVGKHGSSSPPVCSRCRSIHLETSDV